MSKLVLVFSHQLTAEQKVNAKSKFGIDEFIYLPEDLQFFWSNIPPDIYGLKNYLNPLYQWLDKELVEGDYILIQGDFGASFLLVQWAFQRKAIPIYSTSERSIVKSIDNNGELNITRIFKHIRFREYEVLGGN